MKKTLLLVAVLLAVTASVAMAAPGVNLTWGSNCYADGAVPNNAFACNSNTGGVAGTLTLSFMTAAVHTDFVAIGFYLEGQSDAVTLPDWWKMGSGECRANAITMNTGFTTYAGVCTDLWQSLGGGGIGLYSDDTNRMHLNAAWAVADPIQINPGIEYIVGQFNINRSKTVGTGACAGCLTPAIWGLYRLEIGFLGTSTEMLTVPAAGPSSQCTLWQGSQLPCTQPVPARNTTWGQVKSLYR